MLKERMAKLLDALSELAGPPSVTVYGPQVHISDDEMAKLETLLGEDQTRCRCLGSEHDSEHETDI